MVTWINDSSCTIKFASNEQASEAYMKFSIRPATIASDATEEQGVDQRNFDTRIGWREALSYHHDKRGWQNLWVRFATDRDVKKEDTKGENSRFYKSQMKHQKRRYPGMRHKPISKPDKKIVEKKEEPKPLVGEDKPSLQE